MSTVCDTQQMSTVCDTQQTSTVCDTTTLIWLNKKEVEDSKQNATLTYFTFLTLDHQALVPEDVAHTANDLLFFLTIPTRWSH